MDISIITITYKNTPEVLRACFESIAKSEGVSWEFILIDNAGDAQTITRVSEYIPKATCIINNQNKGFSAGVNQGLHRARGRYVLLLNPDTSFAPDVLAKMVAHMDACPEVGIGSSVIRYPDGTLQESIRRFPALRDQLVILFKLPHVLRRNTLLDSYMMRDKDPLVTQDVDSIMGAFMWIRRDALEQVGDFDERYFIWFEEVDYCKMALDAEWKVRHFADVEITHHKGVSFSTVGFLRRQRWIRQSMRKYFWKHQGIFVWGILFMLAPVFILLAYVGVVAIAWRKLFSMISPDALGFVVRKYDPTFRDVGTVFLAHVDRVLQSDAVLVDVGCGRTSYGAEVYQKARKRIGLDVDEYAKENRLMDEVLLMHDDLFPLPTASADVIVAQWVVEHVRRPHIFLAEIHRVLKPGGSFVFMTTNIRSPVMWLTSFLSTKVKSCFRSRVLGYAPDETFETAYAMNTPKQIAHLAEEHGFSVEALERIESYGYFRFSFFVLWIYIQWAKLLRKCTHDRHMHLVGVLRKK